MILKNTLILIAGSLIGFSAITLLTPSNSTDAKDTTESTLETKVTPPRFGSQPKITKAEHNQEKGKLEAIFKEPGTYSKQITKLCEYFRNMNVDQLKQEADLIMNDKFSSYANHEKKFLLNKFIFERWAQLDPKGAIEYINKIPSDLKYFNQETVLKEWLKKDPESVLAYYKNVKFPTHSEVNSIAKSLAEKAPELALDWLKSINIKYKDSINYRIYDQSLAKLTPEEAIQKISSIELTNDYKRELINKYGAKLLEKDWHAGQQWLNTLKTNHEKDRIIGNAIQNIAGKDPERAKSLIPLPLTENNKWSYSGALNEIINKEIESNPEATIDWMKTNKLESINHVFRNALDSWVRNDPEKFHTWMNAQAPGELRDQALSVYSDEVKTLSPQEKLSLLSTVQKKENNYVWQQSLTSALKEWNVTQHEEVKKWIDTADLPDNIRKNLKEQIKPFKTIYDIKDVPPSTEPLNMD